MQDDSANETPANLFFDIRILTGLSQRKCARALGIGETMQFDLEHGRRLESPTARRVRRALYRAALKELRNHV